MHFFENIDFGSLVKSWSIKPIESDDKPKPSVVSDVLIYILWFICTVICTSVITMFINYTKNSWKKKKVEKINLSQK